MPAAGHDIPNARVDRSIQVIVERSELKIDYEVSLAELTLIQDLKSLGLKPVADDRMELYRGYGTAVGPLHAKGFLVRVDQKSIDLGFVGFDLRVEEHPRYVFHLSGSIPASGWLEVRDTNYVSSVGSSRLAIAGGVGIKLSGDRLPAKVEEIPIREVWALDDQEELRTKRVVIEYSRASSSPSPSAASTERGPTTAEVGPQTAPARPRRSGGLTRLLDRGGSLFWSAVFAVFLGMAHSLQPGHGKSLVAATSVAGREGGAGRAALIALTTTVTHFSSILVIAAILLFWKIDDYSGIHFAAAKLAGFAIAAMGLWRLGRLLGGHPIAHVDAAPRGERDRSWLIASIAGGSIPCWEAIALLIVADALGRLPAGIFLCLAFSLGMFAVLVAVSLGAGTLAALGAASRWGSRISFGLQAGSSVVIAAIGLGLYFQVIPKIL